MRLRNIFPSSLEATAAAEGTYAKNSDFFNIESFVYFMP